MSIETWFSLLALVISLSALAFSLYDRKDTRRLTKLQIMEIQQRLGVFEEHTDAGIMEIQQRLGEAETEIKGMSAEFREGRFAFAAGKLDSIEKKL